MKRIGRSDIIGERGMSLIQGVVLAMGHMFYQTGGVEAGIDGFIEIRDVTTGEVGNLLLQVQGKATERERLPGETEATFDFPCDEADIAYWTQGTAPVLFVVVHLRSGKAYWKSIKDWFADPERTRARKIVFDKVADAFTVDAKPAVTAVALMARPGASGPGARIHEDLITNLLGVTFARRLFWAPTEHANDKAFGLALRELDKAAGSEWIVRGKAVLSFHDLDDWPWSRLCETGAIEEFDVEDWSESDDDDRRRDFVALLNRTVGEFVRPDLYHDRDSDVFYFCKPRNRPELVYAYRSLQNSTTRRVVSKLGRKSKTPHRRHSAVSLRFVRLEDRWFAEVTPTYRFSRDGFLPDPRGGERLKKIKEMENNAAVMGQFVMWREFLTTHRTGNLLAQRYPFLAFERLANLTLEVGVPDDLWTSQEADPASPLFEYALAGETVEEVPL